MREEALCKLFGLVLISVIIASSIGMSACASDAAGSSSSATIYVPDDYAKIQDAVDSASEGDTIIVRDGTYRENVKVNRRLTIQSDRGSAPIIEAGRSDAHVLEVTADHVIISGFTVKDANGFSPISKLPVGIYIHADHCTISDNTSENNPYGFFLSEAHNNTLINNTARDNQGDGVYLNFSSGNTLSNNTVVNSEFRNGIRLWHSDSNTLSSNSASNNIGGIRLDYSDNNVLEKNDVQSNENDGIIMYYSNNTRLVDNSAHGNSGDGFIIFSSCNNFLGTNSATVNGYNGISLNAANDHTLSNNNAESNNWTGISLITSDSNTLTNNVASSNNEGGISLYESSTCTLKNNVMDKNTYNLGVSGASIDHVTHSIDTSNRVDGKPVYYWVGEHDREVPKDAGFVGIVNSSNITVRDVTLTHNSAGVMLAYSTNSKIEKVNTANNFNGIALSASMYNIIKNNTNEDNWYGISLDSSDINFLTFNTNENNRDGIVLAASNNNTLIWNTIANSTWTGVTLVDSRNNLIYLNDFLNNGADAFGQNSTTSWNSPSQMTYGYNGVAHTWWMGNYWSGYIREFTGVQIDYDKDDDGIGDLTYSIPGGIEKDYYPLMKPFDDYLYYLGESLTINQKVPPAGLESTTSTTHNTSSDPLRISSTKKVPVVIGDPGRTSPTTIEGKNRTVIDLSHSFVISGARNPRIDLSEGTGKRVIILDKL
jgi:parallel beta-helix repeat protein